MKKISLLLILFINVVTYSQSDFRKGFIVKNNGEKLLGYVNYKENNSVYDYCEFKISLKEKPIKYNSLEVKSYGFDNDKIFESKQIIISNNEKLDVFLEVIVSGTATLYKHKNYYYLEKGLIFKELDNRKINLEKESINYRKSSNKYIGILKILLNDCSDINQSINKTTYRERSLSNLIIKYNSCKGIKSIVYKKDKEWFNAKFGLQVGYTISKNTNGNYPIDHKFKRQIKPNKDFTIGINIDLFTPRLIEKLSIQTGLFFTKNKYNDFEKIINPISNRYTLSEVNIDITEIIIPFGLKYTFPEKFITPYFAIGFNNHISLNSYAIWTIDEFDSTNIIFIKKFDYSPSSTNIGTWVSFRVKKSFFKNTKTLFEIKYTINRNYKNNSESYFERSNSLQILIGLEF